MNMAFDFDDWGRWGFVDLDYDSEAELRTAIASGQPFDTGWHGFRKTEYSMRIQRSAGGTTVSVYDCMDSALGQWDLFCDFLNNDELERLTDEMVDQIREDLYMGDFIEEIEEEETLPADATFDEIMKKVGELIDFCGNRLEDAFRECISITLYEMYGPSDETLNLINERIRHCCPEGE